MVITTVIIQSVNKLSFTSVGIKLAQAVVSLCRLIDDAYLPVGAFVFSMYVLRQKLVNMNCLNVPMLAGYVRTKRQKCHLACFG